MKRITVCLFVLVFCVVVQTAAQTRIEGLLTESSVNPLAIDEKKPHFTWQMSSATRGAAQSAYRIEVTDARGNVVWDSKKTVSRDSLNIAYGGSDLQPATRYHWKVTVWDQKGQPLSAAAWFETGLMNPDPNLSAWDGATWIGGETSDLVLYSQYLSIFKLNYTQRISPGSRQSGFIVGANDRRLMDPNKNVFQLQNKKNESYIRLELDISDVGRSADGLAKFRIYRAGFTDKDKPGEPLASFDVLPTIINEGNKHAEHNFEVRASFGRFVISIDGNSLFAVPKADQPAPATPLKETVVVVNPFGALGEVITLGMLADIGFSVPAQQNAVFSNVTIFNHRRPNNILFKEDLSKPVYDGIFAGHGNRLTIKDGAYTVSGGDQGAFIAADPSHNSMPMLRTRFKTEGAKNIAASRLYVTARGIYEMYLNGTRVGNDHFNPGLTQYPKTHMYQTYDVTKLVTRGENALGAMLGEGWWSGVLSFDNIYNHFGDRQSLLAKLVITYTDGTTSLVTTNDQNWKYFNRGPIVYSSIQWGEVYDATVEDRVKGWDTPVYDDRHWKPAVKIPLDATTAFIEGSPKYDHGQMKLIGQVGNSAGVYKTLTAKSVKEIRPGVFVYDMGQNLVGVPKIVFNNGQAGRKITLRVSEMLYPNLAESRNNVGMIMTENYRAALSQDSYTMKDGYQVFQPRFTFHGYQYLEITGLEKPLPLADVQGVVISSVLKLTADYESSNSKVNRLWSNLVWSNIDNFLSIPTDCPQRNERMGWGGDLSVFAPTATYVSNADQFFKRHLMAMRDLQAPTGRFTDIAPIGGGGGGVLWGSAGITVPWESYLQFGDKALLEEHYPAMAKYMDYLATTINKDTGMSSDGALGDWLGPQYRQLGPAFLVTAYHIYDLRIMMNVAEILGKKDDAGKYSKMYEERKSFFNSKFVNPENKTMAFTSSARGVPPEWKLADTQTSYAVGLALEAFNKEKIPVMAANLAETVRRKNLDDTGVMRGEFALMTGFIGTSWISQALSDHGSPDLAYKLLQNSQYPSWLYPVDQGATSIWERLNGYTTENGFSNNNSMNSFNHYSFGAVGRWLMAYSLGIQRDEKNPGFKHFILQPEPDPTGQMTWARGFYDSVSGKITSSWKVDGNILTYTTTVPANTTATLYLPTVSEKSVREGGKSIPAGPGIRFIKYENGKAVYELGSGNYTFTSSIK